MPDTSIVKRKWVPKKKWFPARKRAIAQAIVRKGAPILRNLKWISKSPLSQTKHTSYEYRTQFSIATSASAGVYANITQFMINKLYDPDYDNATYGRNATVNYFSVLLGNAAGQYSYYVVNSVEYEITLTMQTADRNGLGLIMANRNTKTVPIDYQYYSLAAIGSMPFTDEKPFSSQNGIKPAVFRGIVHLADVWEISKHEWANNTNYRTLYNATPTYPVFLMVMMGNGSGDTYNTATYTGNVSLNLKMNVTLHQPNYTP